MVWETWEPSRIRPTIPSEYNGHSQDIVRHTLNHLPRIFELNRQTLIKTLIFKDFKIQEDTAGPLKMNRIGVNQAKIFSLHTT